MRDIHSTRNSSSMSSVSKAKVREDIYPPVTPRWPPGRWGEFDEEQAWEFYENAVQVEDTKSLWDKLKKLTDETKHFYSLNPLLENSPPRILPYQQYLTKTHLVMDELPLLYENIDTASLFPAIRSIVIKTLISKNKHLNDKFILQGKNPVSDITSQMMEQERSEQLVVAMYNVISNYLSSMYPHILWSQKDIKSDQEAFWCVGGLKEECDGRADDESLFLQFNNQPTLSVRINDPLPVMVSLDDPLCQVADLPNVSYHIPQVYEIKGTECNGLYNAGFLTKTPFNDGNPVEFGQLLINTISQVNGYRGDYSVKEVRDLTIGCGLVSGFGWALTQAYSQGFSWMQDLTYPLSSQTIVFDGKNISFYVYQLNTIALWSKGEKGIPYNNICWALPEVPLFDEITDDSVIGFNDDALKSLLKFLLLKPEQRAIEMRPFLNESPKDVKRFMNCVGEPVIEREHPPRLYTKSMKEKVISPIVITGERIDKIWNRAGEHWNEKTRRFE